MIKMANVDALIIEQFLSNAQSSKKAAKPELLELDVTVKESGDFTYVAAEAIFRKPAQKETVVFHENNVRIGYKMYSIFVEETGTIDQVFGIPFRTNVKRKEYIVRDGKKLYIKKDFQGNKFLEA